MGQGRVISARRLATVLVLVVACSPMSATSGTVRGTVVSVEGGLTEVTSFAVLVEGEEMHFLPIEDGNYDFPLPHLGDHQRSGVLVVVGWELRDDIRYAVSVADG